MVNPRHHSNPTWFERLSRRPNPALRLFCFPYAGGSAQIFRPWRQHVPPEVDLYLVHLPGHNNRFVERPFTRLKLLVEAIADHIRGELQHPFAFYGHSMGALISFELARELRRRHRIEPVELFLSGRGAPHLPIEPPTFNLPHDEFVGRLRELNGTPPEILENTEIAEVFLPILRADFELVDTYEYQPEARLSCPITIYGGDQDKEVPLSALRAWEEHTPGFTIRVFAGDHFFIHAPSTRFPEVLRHDLSDRLRNLAPGLKIPPVRSS